TRTTEQEAQATTNVNVHVGIWVVIRHVIEHAVDANCRTVRDAEANACERAAAVVVRVTEVIIGVARELIAGASRTGADDELALAATNEVPDREIVVQTQRECVGVDISDARCRCELIALRRVVAVAFELPPW